MALIEFDTKELTDFLDTLASRIEKNFNSKASLKESSEFLADLIKRRTLSGLDVDLKPFARSSTRGGPSQKVNLVDTGQMVNSIEARVINDNEAVVGIFDPVQQRKAIIHQLGLGNVPQRRFLGLSDQDTGTVDEIVAIFAKRLNEAINKIT